MDKLDENKRGFRRKTGNLLIATFFIVGYLIVVYLDRRFDWPIYLRIPAALVLALPVLLVGVHLGGGGEAECKNDGKDKRG